MNKELLGSFDLKSECEKCKKIYDKKDLIEELICSNCWKEWTNWVKYDNGIANYGAFLKWTKIFLIALSMKSLNSLIS